jgi:hypothetical protein
VLNNCTVANNFCVGDPTFAFGGGALDATLNNCLVSGNQANGSNGGGGAMGGVLYKCTVVSNSTTSVGGGIRGGTASHCLIAGNSANAGGGVEGSKLANCTVVNNSATWGGGGVYQAYVTNCIVYDNSAPTGPNYQSLMGALYSCTTPNPGGTGNISGTPLFVGGGNYRLQAASPCIDTGSNALMPVGNDLDGKLRPLDGNGDGTATVDMGCYEYGTVTPVAPTIHGLQPGGGGGTLMLSWSSVADQVYRIETTTNLLLGFNEILTSSIAATPTTNVFVLPPDPAAPSRFYRLAVE